MCKKKNNKGTKRNRPHSADDPENEPQAKMNRLTQRDLIIKAYNQGLKKCDIAKQFNVTRHVVDYAIKASDKYKLNISASEGSPTSQVILFCIPSKQTINV